MQLVGAKQVSSRGALALAGLRGKRTPVIGGDGGFSHTRCRDRSRIFCRREIATRCFGRVEQLSLLSLESRSARRDLGLLPLAALSVQVGAVELLAQIPQRPFALLDIGARNAQCGANFLLVPRVGIESSVRGSKRGLELRKLARRALELGANASRYLIALASLFLRTLPPRSRIAQPFLGDRNLSAQLLGAFALIGDETAQLGAPGFGGSASGERSVARPFGGAKPRFFRGDFSPKARYSLFQSEEISAPRVHLA